MNNKFYGDIKSIFYKKIFNQKHKYRRFDYGFQSIIIEKDINGIKLPMNRLTNLFWDQGVNHNLKRLFEELSLKKVDITTKFALSELTSLSLGWNLR